MVNLTQSNPLVSIIIPVKNGSRTIDACLRSIRRSYYKNIEVIVVDDHSTDETVEIAKRNGCIVLQLQDGSGANCARNYGASQAKGVFLIFIDSDIVIKRDTILAIVEELEEGGADAVVGIYTARHRHETFVSQYKNLWVRYSYLKSSPAIDWLFGSVSGIKREAFEKIGGFDADLLVHHGHDDIELGKRLARANLNITLDMDIEVEHLKYYTLGSFIKNEFNRSYGFAKLATELGETTRSLKKGFVNVYPAFVFSTLMSLVVLGVAIASLIGELSYWYIVVVAAIYLLLNIRFLNYLEQVRGFFAMIVMIPILFLDHLVCFVGSVVGVVKGLLGRKSL